MVTADTAFAGAYVIDACRSIHAEALLASIERLPEDLPDDLILIGGPSGNELTGTILREWCPGFRLRGDESEDGDFRTTYYECGSRQFIDGDEDAWAFVVKLSPSDTGTGYSTTLLWGHTSAGTTGAAYILRYRTHLLRVDSKHSFFLAFKLRRQLGHRSAPTTRVDLTEIAFNLESPST